MFARFASLFAVFLLAACRGPADRGPVLTRAAPIGLGSADLPPEGWTWALARVGTAPAQRYGVAGPNAAPRGQALILPAFGQTAEDQFRLANALVEHAFSPWILDRQGQGGSARPLPWRAIADASSLKPEAAVTAAMLERAMASDTAGPKVLVALGDSADTALAALRARPNADGLVLVAPTRQAPAGARFHPALDHASRGLGLGWLPAWRRDGAVASPADPDPAVFRAWRRADPALAVEGPSLGWLAAAQDQQAQAEHAGYARLTLPVLILTDPAARPPEAALADHLCRALPHCFQRSAGSAAEARQAIISFAETLAVQGEATPLDYPKPQHWMVKKPSPTLRRPHRRR